MLPPANRVVIDAQNNPLLSTTHGGTMIFLQQMILCCHLRRPTKDKASF